MDEYGHNCIFCCLVLCVNYINTGFYKLWHGFRYKEEKITMEAIPRMLNKRDCFLQRKMHHEN